MRRIFSILRASFMTPVLIALYASLRWWASTGHSAARFPDSLGYSHPQFFGNNVRFWPIPFLYSFAPSDQQKILLQVLVGVCVWGYAAWVASKYSRFRTSFALAVLVIGLTPQVIRFDIGILSESLGISFAVCALASTVHMTRSQHPAIKGLWFVSIVLTAFTRPHQLILLFVLAIAFSLRALLRRSSRNRRIAIVFVLLSLWGVMQLNGNTPQSTVNFYTLLQKRICGEPAMNTWFINNGMPEIEGICDVAGYAYSYDVKNTVGEILQLPEGQQPLATMITGDIPMARWVVEKGWSTYSQYVFTHPSYVVQVLRESIGDALDAHSHDFLPTDVRTVVPEETLDPWWLWAGVGSVGVVLIALSSMRRKQWRMYLAIGFLVAAIFIAGVLTSAVEVERHAATSAVAIRLFTIFAISEIFVRSTKQPVENDVEHAE